MIKSFNRYTLLFFIFLILQVLIFKDTILIILMHRNWLSATFFSIMICLLWLFFRHKNKYTVLKYVLLALCIGILFSDTIQNVLGNRIVSTKNVPILASEMFLNRYTRRIEEIPVKSICFPVFIPNYMPAKIDNDGTPVKSELQYAYYQDQAECKQQAVALFYNYTNHFFNHLDIFEVSSTYDYNFRYGLEELSLLNEKIATSNDQVVINETQIIFIPLERYNQGWPRYKEITSTAKYELAYVEKEGTHIYIRYRLPSDKSKTNTFTRQEIIDIVASLQAVTN